MQLKIVGASKFVNRMFEACGSFQWAREFLQNSREANAKKVEFGVEWQAVQKFGVYRRFIADDGIGMEETELLDYFSTLGSGSKKIGGVHENFGIGSKVSALPWNPNGVVVLSRKNGKTSMIRILLNRETEEYELFEFETDEGISCVINPDDFTWPESDIDWSRVMPDWIAEHGSVVVLLGSDENKDTIRGNVKAGEDGTASLSLYLNSRFWDLGDTEVRVVEFNHKKKEFWPLDPEFAPKEQKAKARNVTGAKYFLEGIEIEGGILKDFGLMRLANNQLTLRYYLWEGLRPKVSHYAQENGFIAVKYKNELFELSTKKSLFRGFGIIDSKLQRRLTFILEPNLYDPKINDWGVHPDQSRNRLIFTGDTHRGSTLPFDDWGHEFSTKLPQSINDAINEARSEIENRISDNEYRKRLQDKFGKRWKAPFLFEAKTPDEQLPNAVPLDSKLFSGSESSPVDGDSKNVAAKPKLLSKRAAYSDASGNIKGEEREATLDIPRYEYASKEDFDEPWHLALWAPSHPQGPTVLLNRDADFFSEQVKHHQDGYPPFFAEAIQMIVLQVYGEVAACKLAHSQKLRKRVSKEELDRDYRNSAALTMALLGLMAEESAIAKRLKDEVFEAASAHS